MHSDGVGSEQQVLAGSPGGVRKGTLGHAQSLEDAWGDNLHHRSAKILLLPLRRSLLELYFTVFVLLGHRA